MTIATDRRSLLTSAGTLLLGGCAHCTFPAPSAATAAIGDAHAHFFSITDLPVAGFAKFVLIPRHFGGFPEWAQAVVDIIAWIAQALSNTADAEARRLGSGTLGGSRGTKPSDFGREAARAHRAGLAGRTLGDRNGRRDRLSGEPEMHSDERSASHRALARMLGAQSEFRGLRALTEADFAAIARENPRADAAPPADDLQCSAVQSGMFEEQALAGIRFLLRWAYLLCRPRCVHVEEYLKAIHREATRIGDVVNLLIDYDKWLDDRPRAGSQTASQVAYWTRYSDISATVPGRPRLHTFAGYDPLRDAEERVLENTPDNATSFAAMQQWALEGRNPQSTAPRKIAGFKVYPPMGFRPDTNATIDVPNARGGAAIRDRWGSKFAQIGEEIDNSLSAFFKFCGDHDIPIMAHARESNIALPEHGDDPSPRHWLERARMVRQAGLAPLRVCIGHFDMIECPGTTTDAQVLREALALNAAGDARIYFDIAFDDRILQGQAKALFDDLAKVCSPFANGADHVMFGSDWIMLANQPNVGEYLNMVHAAASVHDYWGEKQRLAKLFGGNLAAFLNRPIS